ncbi:MAG: HD domain-containing protein, partial [Candidatus Hodarchaeota archaeon]
MKLTDKLKEFEKQKSIHENDNHTLRMNHIIEDCKNISKTLVAMNPHFTCHDIRHSIAIIEILDDLCEDLLDDTNKLSLNYNEVFCLLASCYLHDTGMILSKDTDEAKVKERRDIENKPYLSIGDLRRREHHSRSAEYIFEHKKTLQLNIHLATIIGKICKGHRKVDLNDDEFNDVILTNEIVRVRLLAALLRLADELDLSYTRIPRDFEEIFNAEKNFEFLSQIHFIKHLYTSGIVIGLEQIGNDRIKTINISLRVPNKEYERRMNAIIRGPIVREINYTRPIL